MQLCLLGHVEARLDDVPLELGGAKQRAVLAMLGLEANRTVTADRLIEGLWGEEAPASAAKMVQNYVWRLRKALSEDGGAEILTRGRAYELKIDRELVDVLRLERLVAEAARTPNGDTARQALALFRGEPLADVADEPFASSEIRRLEELRLTAAELAIDADLAAGRHHEVVAEIDALLTANPLRERLHVQRLLALYRCGRQADALEAYRRARETLVEQIGVEPGPELQRVHAAILRQDPALDVQPAATELAAELDAAAAPPLIGREREIATLRDLWRRGDGGLVTVAGAYGTGKTRLAAELARHCHQHGATVLYASGSGPPEVALAAITRAQAARRPTLLVLDDADRAPVEVRRALSDLRRGQALTLATGLQPAALARLGPREALALEPLDGEGVRAIAALYAPAGSEIPVDDLLAATRGVPRRVHEAAGEWARREATHRVDTLADRAASGRSEARALETKLAGSVIDLQSTRQRLAQFDGARDRRDDPVICPYKGLAPFDRDDAEYFFGREELVAELVAHVVGTSLLAVVGPSGSGKSSVVRAGLLPALAGGVLSGSHNWMQAVMRPGAHPMRDLRRATRRLAPHERSVLVVDQFEELFTACHDERERAEFATALTRYRGGVVVIVVRADFYGHCAAYPELSRALGANHVLVGAMSRDELRRAIERPAQRAGLSVEPELVQALLSDVEGQPGALPLLSTALLELWTRRDGRRLQLAAYARSGGVEGAVARLAEEAFVALSPAQQAAARTLMLRLSDEDESGAIVRRRIALDGQDPDVVGRLTERRLLTVSEGAVEVAHEALLREWPRLRGWLAEDAQGRRVHRALREAARAWDQDARDPGGLYRGARLAAALDWAADHEPELEPVERAFLDAARRASGRAQRRLRLVLAGVAALAIVAVITGVVALDQRDQARDQATTAAAQRLGSQALVAGDLDRSLLLARQGVALSDTAQTRGNLLAALVKSPAAIGVLDVPGTDERAGSRIALDGRLLVVMNGDGTLHRFDAVTHRPLGRPQPVTGGMYGVVAFDGSGSRVVVGGQPPQIADVRTRQVLTTIDTAGFGLDLRFSRDGLTVFATLGFGSGTAVQRFDADTGEALGNPVRLGANEPAAVLVARDGRRIVTSVSDGRTTIRDAHTLRPLETLAVRATAVALSPDDRTLIAGARDGSVRFVDLESGTVRSATGRHDGAVVAIAVSPDGRVAATGGEDNRVQIWDTGRRTVRATFSGHTSEVGALAFSADSRTLFSAALDSKLLIWDLAGDRRLDRPFAIERLDTAPFGPMPSYLTSTPLSYDTSPDGRTLALGGGDGTVSLIDLRTLRTRSRHRVVGSSWVASVGYLPDGRLLVSDHSGSASILDPTTGDVGPTLKGFGTSATPSFSRDRRLMAAAGSGGTVNIRTLRHGQPSDPPRVYLRDAASVALSPDGRSIAIAGFTDVEIGDTATLRRRTRVPDSHGTPTTVRYSPDGRFLAVGDMDGSVRVWSTKTWRSQRFRALTAPVLYLAVSADSRMLAVGGADGAIRLFDLPSQRPLGTPLPAIPNRLAAPLFTRDGAYLLVITDAGVAYRWDVRLSSWARHACDVAGRSLTRAEWREELPDRPYAPAC